MSGWEIYEFVLDTVVGLSFIYAGMFMTYKYCVLQDDKKTDH